jgi:hypothetical protein
MATGCLWLCSALAMATFGYDFCSLWLRLAFAMAAMLGLASAMLGCAFGWLWLCSALVGFILLRLRLALGYARLQLWLCLAMALLELAMASLGLCYGFGWLWLWHRLAMALVGLAWLGLLAPPA